MKIIFGNFVHKNAISEIASVPGTCAAKWPVVMNPKFHFVKNVTVTSAM